MKQKPLMVAKLGSTLLLSIGSIVSLTLAVISWPIASKSMIGWAVVFLASAIFMIIGVIQNWRSDGLFSKITIAALAYAVILYGYINWVAPSLPEPFGFSVAPNKTFKFAPSDPEALTRAA